MTERWQDRPSFVDAPCPRILTKEQIVAGLQAGRKLYIDRRYAPAERPGGADAPLRVSEKAIQQ